MSILALSHTDLDGISAQIVLRKFRGDLTLMNASYGKIDEYIEILSDYCIHQKPNEVWITDLSFTLEQLTKLCEIVKMNKDIMFTFIDHHPFKEDFSHLLRDNFKIIISDKASATKLVYKYLLYKTPENKKNKSDLVALENYVDYVNAYDLWETDNPKFKGAMVYNELFWEFKKDYYYTRFKDEFKLRNADKERYKELMSKKEKLFGKLDKSGRIYKHEPDGHKRIFMIFIDDFKNHITLDFPDFDVYIIISSYGGVSIRLRSDNFSDGEFKDRVVAKILEHENINTAGGHPKAFGCIINGANAHTQVEFAKYLLKVIDEELDRLSI
jgi:oligoribonuclease NrnB/cAMP/cGMP phosphodiesterase (DHH superfamily)